MGIRALTFRAWYEAVHGVEAWEALYKIPTAVWQDYLNWIVEAFELPIAPQLFPSLAAHTCDDIDFKALAGRRVAVIGVGSSAWDNAATALEQGAAHVTLYARRSHLPQINKAKASTYPGFVEGWQTLPPADKWTLASYFDDTPPPPPHETVLRTLAAAGDQRFTLHFDTRFEHVAEDDGQVVLALEGRVERADFLSRHAISTTTPAGEAEWELEKTPYLHR